MSDKPWTWIVLPMSKRALVYGYLGDSEKPRVEVFMKVTQMRRYLMRLEREIKACRWRLKRERGKS